MSEINQDCRELKTGMSRIKCASFDIPCPQHGPHSVHVIDLLHEAETEGVHMGMNFCIAVLGEIAQGFKQSGDAGMSSVVEGILQTVKDRRSEMLVNR